MRRTDLATSILTLLIFGGVIWYAQRACLPQPTYSGDTVRVATWNVHRFFDDHCDSGSCGTGAPEGLYSTEDWQTRGRDIANAIMALEADIISLQEIENERSFQQIYQHLNSEYSHYAYAENGRAGSIDVAIVSRLPIEEILRHRRIPSINEDEVEGRLTRQLLEIHIEHNGTKLVVLAAHFKSKYQYDPERRLREAEYVATLSTNLLREGVDAVVLAGDLNDTPDSTTLAALGTDGPYEVDDDADFTYLFRGDEETIDYVIAASERCTIVDREAHGSRQGYVGSDHRSVTGTLVCWPDD